MAEHFYRITVILRDGKKMEGIREHTSADVDTVYLIYHRQADEEWWMNRDLKAQLTSSGKSRNGSMQRQFGKKKE